MYSKKRKKSRCRAMSGGWSKQICHCSSQFRNNIHVVTLQDCPHRLRVHGSTVWALESLQRPKWGWASRSWVLDAVASEFVDDCVILAVDVSKIFFFFEDIQIEKR